MADIVGYSRLAGADEDRILARLQTLRSDLIDPILAVHHGRVVKRTGDGAIVEFRSVVDAVRCSRCITEELQAMATQHSATGLCWPPLAAAGAGRGGPTHAEFAAFLLNESHVSRNLALTH
jgi:class 3 adenylate cyclase